MRSGSAISGRGRQKISASSLSINSSIFLTNAARREGAEGYSVIDPDQEGRTDYRSVYDASGDPAIVDRIAPHLAKGAEITLAGFYADRVSFAFPPVFMKEARLRVAAEFEQRDLEQTNAMIASGKLDLSGMISDRAPAERAEAAYPKAFSDPDCLKMVLDWRGCA